MLVRYHDWHACAPQTLSVGFDTLAPFIHGERTAGGCPVLVHSSAILCVESARVCLVFFAL